MGMCGEDITQCVHMQYTYIALFSDLSLQQTSLTPVHYAANFGKIDALRLLILEFGCDPNTIKDQVTVWLRSATRMLSFAYVHRTETLRAL